MIQQAWSRSLDRSSSHPQAQQQTWPSPRCRCGSAAIVCMCWGGGSGVKTRPRRRTPRGEGQKDVDTNQLHQSPQQTISHLSLTSSHPHILTLTLTLTLTLASLHPSLCAHLRAVELATGNVGGFVIGREATKSLGCSVNELVVVNPAGADKHHAWARVVCLDVLDKVVPCDGPAAHTKKKKARQDTPRVSAHDSAVQCSAWWQWEQHRQCTQHVADSLSAGQWNTHLMFSSGPRMV